MKQLSDVRVLVADDSATWRHVVTSQLPDMSLQVVGTAVDGVQAVQKAISLRPDIILLDIWMPALNGLAAIGQIRKVAPASRILIVSNEADPDIVRAAFDAGARGYVLKSLAAIELSKALQAIVRGDLFIGRGLLPNDSEDPHGSA